MPEEFQQTVDLKDRLNNKASVSDNRLAKTKVGSAAKAEEIDNVYEPDRTDADLKRIIKPNIFHINEKLMYRAITVLGILILILLVWWLFPGHKKDTGTAAVGNQEQVPGQVKWYMIKLANNEVYYGQVGDMKADPVVVSSVYYNYDQAQGKPVADTTTLRLVKKGKESYGPTGTMEIPRVQVLFFDELRPDSKVLKAILDYEGSGK